MKRSVFLLMHAFVWIVATAFVILVGWQTSDGLSIPDTFHVVNSFLAIAWMLIIFYTFYSYVFPRFFQSGKMAQFIIISLLVLGIYPLLTYLVFGLQHIIFKREYGFGHLTWEGYFGTILAIVFIGALGSGYRMIIDGFTFAQEKAELEKQSLTSELQLLKYKLNPHFLFNTLNNIDSLIVEDQEKASLALNKLSEMMRYMIYDAEKESVTLDEEISYIENYIHLQKLRGAYPDNIQFEFTGKTDSVNVAPMLFLPLVENAFKHSSTNKKETQIDISIEIKDNILIFNCINTLPDSAIEKDSTSGIGLDIIRKRLELIYDSNFEFNIYKKHDHYRVSLIIYLDAN